MILRKSILTFKPNSIWLQIHQTRSAQRSTSLSHQFVCFDRNVNEIELNWFNAFLVFIWNAKMKFQFNFFVLAQQLRIQWTLCNSFSPWIYQYQSCTTASCRQTFCDKINTDVSLASHSHAVCDFFFFRSSLPIEKKRNSILFSFRCLSLRCFFIDFCITSLRHRLNLSQRTNQISLVADASTIIRRKILKTVCFLFHFFWQRVSAVTSVVGVRTNSFY